MTKQAEADYTKASKEMAQQEQKIEKANELIEKELKLQQDLKKETESIVEEKNVLTKECNEFETVLNGYKENLRLAKEGESNLIYFFSELASAPDDSMGYKIEIPKDLDVVITPILSTLPNLFKNARIFLLIFFALQLNKNQPDFVVT